MATFRVGTSWTGSSGGGFPEAVKRDPDRRGRWFDDYATTVARSVIRELAHIERLAELPWLLRLCAARTATELNVSAVAGDFGVEVKATSTPRTSHLKGLRFLADRLGDRFHFGVLLSASPKPPRSAPAWPPSG